MSTGGAFRIFINKGRMDEILTALGKLERTMDKIRDVTLHKLLQKNDDIASAYDNAWEKGETAAAKFEEKLYNRYISWMPLLRELRKDYIVFPTFFYKPFIPIGYQYFRTKGQGIQKTGGTMSFTLDVKGDFLNDMAVHVRLKNLRATDPADKVRYVQFLGHRLFKKVAFRIQGNLIDEYTTDEYNKYYNFRVNSSKKAGWERAVGQERPNLGYLTQNPTTDEIREYKWFGTGPQTFKRSHDVVDLWIPLIFFFKDIRFAIPNFVIPHGQTTVTIDMATQAELTAFANYGGGGAFTGPDITKMELYTNHIFMIPEIFDIYAKKFGFMLVRVHRRQSKVLKRSKDNILLNDMKWPIETMYICFRPRANLDNSQTWYRNEVLTETDVKIPVVTPGDIVAVNNATYFEPSDPITSLELRAHDVIIYEKANPKFYDSYIPLRYGENFSTPEHQGWYVMNFNFYPDKAQPSGHVNSSRERELRLLYESDYIGPNNLVDLVILADVLNVMVIKDGSAHLKFST